MTKVAVLLAVALAAMLLAACVIVWRRTMKDIDDHMADWDRRFYDEFFGEIGRISTK